MRITLFSIMPLICVCVCVCVCVCLCVGGWLGECLCLCVWVCGYRCACACVCPCVCVCAIIARFLLLYLGNQRPCKLLHLCSKNRNLGASSHSSDCLQPWGLYYYGSGAFWSLCNNICTSLHIQTLSLYSRLKRVHESHSKGIIKWEKLYVSYL